jgi:hypothetical protein
MNYSLLPTSGFLMRHQTANPESALGFIKKLLFISIMVDGFPSL